MTWRSNAAARICPALLVVWTVLASRATGQTDPAVPQLAPVPGGQLEFHVRGDGEPVVLIHGSVIAEALLPLASEPALSGYQVIRVHRRGYAGSSEVGESFGIDRDAADVAALLRHLGVARAHIVGHSAGGIVAIEFAATFPDMVQTLTVLDPPLVFARASNLTPRTGGADAAESFILGVGAPDLREQLQARLPGALEQARQDERRFNAVEWPALGAWEFNEARAREIPAPVLYVAEERDARIDAAGGWWPEMEYVELPGETHMFPFEAPEPTARSIADFLSRHPM